MATKESFQARQRTVRACGSSTRSCRCCCPFETTAGLLLSVRMLLTCIAVFLVFLQASSSSTPVPGNFNAVRIDTAYAPVPSRRPNAAPQRLHFNHGCCGLASLFRRKCIHHTRLLPHAQFASLSVFLPLLPDPICKDENERVHTI